VATHLPRLIEGQELEERILGGNQLTSGDRLDGRVDCQWSRGSFHKKLHQEGTGGGKY